MEGEEHRLSHADKKENAMEHQSLERKTGYKAVEE